ncbi:TonB-dependent receptor domain-containing protein [Croceicoccus sp. BE223]|uniref:TonB-dependent receptor n=1 Tax=Croceicoccus sp. BE223 TaxID=2817716 RepID=UPI00285DBFDC|nr:TonB-dependent receptor [Croceicoccus sp. BE223]MDR7101181.1 iron complex outermembrane receptor protein [Croceicoccus sp. BE223]
MRLTYLAASSALVAIMTSVPALAQDASDPRPADASVSSDTTSGGLDEIVVTAQRREESMQDVPIAVSAFSPDQLAKQGITNTLEVSQFVPNMIANNNTGLGSANSFFLRGLGNSETIPTFDPPVGVYVDEIYLSRQNANNLSLFDVERVEVLRGPQGTLFGRNTTGGAVSVVMAQPDFGRIGGFAEVGYGAFDKKLARGSIDLPLADSFAIKISGYWQDDDGYAKNVTTGERLNDDDGWGARLGLRGEMADWARFSGSYSHIVANGENLVNFECNRADPTDCNGRFISSGMTTAQAPDYPVTVTGRKADFALGNKTQSDIVIGKFDFDVSRSATLSLITGYVRQEQQYALDFYDGSGAPSLSNPYPAVRGAEFGGFVIANDSYADQFSQEAKLSGSLADGLVDYTTGIYYIKEKNYSDFADIFGLSTTSALLLADRTLRNSTEAIAGYVQGDFNVTDRLKLTAGVRYTDETKKIDFSDNRAQCQVTPLPANCLDTANLYAPNGEAIPTELKTKIWTPRFAVNFKANPDVLLFASATRGFKSGGWAARVSSPTQALPFDPEKVWSYEAGIKSELFDRKLRANLTLYWMDVSDLQTPSGVINASGSVTFITRNFADYRNRGAELELTFAPIDGLNLFFNGGYQDDKYIIDYDAPEFDEYGTRSVGAQQALCQAAIAGGAVGGGTGTTGFCGAGIVTPNGDIAEPVRTPDWTLSFGGSYEAMLGNNLTLTPSVAASWHSKQEVQTGNLTIYSGSVTGTNGTYPANPQGGDFIVGSYSAAAWQVNAGLTLATQDRDWSLSLTCSNCFNDSFVQSYLGWSYLNAPRTWMARLRREF